MSEGSDAAVGRLATRQHGLITTRQAVDLGLSTDQVHRRLASGRWVRVGRGVHRIAGTSPTWQQTALASTLVRPGAATSYLTAAALGGVSVAPPPRPWLTVAPGTSGRSTLAIVRRRLLPSDQVTTRFGIPTTTGARTLVDCSEILGENRLRKVVDETMHLRLCTCNEVDEVIEGINDPRRRRQHQMLLELLEIWRPTIRPGSTAEARLLRQLSDWGFPEPQRQIKIVDGQGVVIARLDGGWTDRRFGFEYDSVQWHGPAAWASDEERHAMVEALGWRLLHIDKADLLPGASRLRDELVVEFARRPIAI